MTGRGAIATNTSSLPKVRAKRPDFDDRERINAVRERILAVKAKLWNQMLGGEISHKEMRQIEDQCDQIINRIAKLRSKVTPSHMLLIAEAERILKGAADRRAG
jgi:hypothetical protein